MPRIELSAVDRFMVFERDDWECIACGETRATLEVHHQDGDATNNKPENLATLCGTCHKWIHSGYLSLFWHNGRHTARFDRPLPSYKERFLKHNRDKIGRMAEGKMPFYRIGEGSVKEQERKYIQEKILSFLVHNETICINDFAKIMGRPLNNIRALWREIRMGLGLIKHHTKRWTRYYTLEREKQCQLF